MEGDIGIADSVTNGMKQQCDTKARLLWLEDLLSRTTWATPTSMAVLLCRFTDAQVVGSPWERTRPVISLLLFARFIIAYSQIIILLTPDRTWLWRLAKSAVKRRQAAGWHGNNICGENLLQKIIMSWLMVIHKSLSLLLLLKLLYCGIISKVKENILGQQKTG